jgi:membrane-bound metal-dependent hydrolase YbcI (DUF457 family)
MAGLLGGSALARKRRLLWPLAVTGVIAAVMPDVDVPILGVVYLFHDYGYPDFAAFFHKFHHLYTHSLFEAPLFAVLAALPAWVWVKRDYLYIYLVAAVNAVIHVALDWPFDWPLMPFWPFSTFCNNDSSFLKMPPGTYTSVPALVAISLLALVVLYFRSNQNDGEDKE